MSDSTIANLTSGSPAQTTDVFPIQRSSSTLKLTVGDVVAVAQQWPSESANTILAGPTSGSAAAATFRSMVAADMIVFVGDSGSGGVQGAVPAPGSGDYLAGKYLSAGGTWSAPPGSGVAAWSSLSNPVAGLTLNNASYATEFDQTSNVIWLWKNTTVATVSTTNASPLLELAANYWATGSSSAADTWSIGTSLAAGLNGLSTLTIAHAGSTAQPTITLPPSATNVTTPAVTFGTATYGVGGSSASALNIYSPTGAGNIAVTGVQAGTARWQIGSVDTGPTKMFIGVTDAEWGMAFAHGLVTNTSIPGFNFADNSTTGTGHMAAVSGTTQIHATFAASFVPASGASPFVCLQINPTINQTSTASGSYTALQVNVVETSLKGSANRLLDLQAGSTGGVSKFSVSNLGDVNVGRKVNTNSADMAGSVTSAPTGIVAATVVVAAGGATGTFTVTSTEGFTVGATITLSATGWTSGSGLASTTATVTTITGGTTLALTYVSGGPWVAGTYTGQTGTLAQTGGTAVTVTYVTAYTNTPFVTVTPTSNVGAFYLSASSNAGFTVTYANSGAQKFNYIVLGNQS